VFTPSINRHTPTPMADLLMKPRQRCHESFSTGMFGTSIMAAPLCLLPFPGRHPGMMPVESPPASSAPDDQPGKVLSGARQGPSLHWEGWKEVLSPLCREGRLQVKISPLAGRKKRMREGSGPVPKNKTSRHVASGSHGEISCHPPGTRMEDARRKSTTTDLQKESVPRQAW
jgi:hypothetical protein